MSFKIIIPARYASSRLPGKPLLDIAGKPMIQHVYERATESDASEVIIATDNQEIADVARQFGADICMTADSHRSGTDRLAEVVKQRGFADNDIVLNVQGDEPTLPALLINQVAADLAEFPQADMASLFSRIEQEKQVFDPNVVKVVMDVEGFALYFSRAPIPWMREHFNKDTPLPPELPHYRHIGLYGYRAGFLKHYSDLTPCLLETDESLEQLRALFHGKRIHMSEALVSAGHGVDTENDLEAVRALLA
jgi:3-deoxy-manno-octulosonate cytidylyltransferase (CMP-KDO synthetase)